MIDTNGISKWKILKALYDNSRPLGLGFLHYTPEPMPEKEARELVKDQTYFDYVRGRVIKVNLENPDGFEEWLYDRDNGPGAAQRVIAELHNVSGT